MRFTFTPMNEADARIITSWRYDGPYSVYSLSDEDASGGDILAEMLDRRSPHYAVHDEQGELVGYFSFGTSCLVWDSDEPGLYLDKERKTIAIGLGLRPDLTGRGVGLAFVQAGLDFARQAFAPASFVLFVYTWNERAIRVYERAGFRRVRVFSQSNIHGESEWLEMAREA